MARTPRYLPAAARVLPAFTVSEWPPRALTASRSIKKTPISPVQVKEMVASPHDLSVLLCSETIQIILEAIRRQNVQFRSRMIHPTSTMTIIRLLCYVVRFYALLQ